MAAFGSERLLSAASIWACSVGHSLASAGPAAAAAMTRAMTKVFISLPPSGLSTGPSSLLRIGNSDVRGHRENEPVPVAVPLHDGLTLQGYRFHEGGTRRGIQLCKRGDRRRRPQHREFYE